MSAFQVGKKLTEKFVDGPNRVTLKTLLARWMVIASKSDGIPI